ncbi:MAG: C-terminal binding protein [Planctomycetaceae bacterium]
MGASPQYRVLITDRAWPNLDIERRVLAEADAVPIDAPSSDEATLVELARDVDAIATCWAKVTPAVILAAARCRVIARFGIGLDNICLETATARGIPVTCVPDYCVAEVADHTLALLLACARKVAFFHLRTKGGEYNLQNGPSLRRISGQKLGLVGFGRIARSLYPKAKALGLEVLACSSSGDPHGTECRMVTLEQLLGESDYVSLHLPLNDRTRQLIGWPELQRMKTSAYLINTSRGAIVDSRALARALENGEIAGAALDVFDPEPPELADPLYRNERVIVTPHAAFLSEESLSELRLRTSTQIVHVLQGRRPEHVANAQVYGNPPQMSGF